MRLDLRILPLLFLPFFTQKMAAQGPFPFPTDSVSWSWGTVWPQVGINDFYGYGEVEMRGDTFFEGKKYSILRSLTLCSCSCPSFQSMTGWYPIPNQTTHLSLLRVDGPKVYIRYFSDTTDILRFDFSLQPLDSFAYAGKKFVVESIKTDPSTGRKTWKLVTGPPSPGQYTDFWIEGEADPLRQPSTTSTIPYQVYGCFSNSLPTTCNRPCQPLVGVSSEESEAQSALKFAPNPVFDFFKLNFEKDESLVVAVFSVDGRLLFEKKGVQKGQPVKVSQLPSGFFLMVARGENGQVWTERFFKI